VEPVLVPVVWSLIAGACFTLGTVYLIAWLNDVGEREHLAFLVLAMSMGALTLFELAIMRAATPQQAGQLIRWAHVPTATAVLSIVAFLHFYIGSRWPWVGVAACVLRLAALALNFYFEPNLSYVALTGLERITLFGETAVVPVGEPNPWMRVAGLSTVLLLVFAVDSTLTGLRKNTPVERRRGLLIGGSVVLLVLLSALTSALVHAGIIRSVYLFAGPAFVLVLAMSIELGADTVRSLHVSALLKQSETDLKTANEQIERERAFLRQVIDTMPGLLFAKDRRGAFTLANRAVADLYGCPVDQLLGRTDADLNVRAEEVSHFRADDLAVMDSREQRFIPEEQVTGADGRTRWLMTMKVPIVDSTGAADQVLGSSVDITARKMAELEVEQQRNELAHLSRVTMLSELSGSLTHELNQPLTAILSNAQAALRFLAADEPNLDELREILSDIVSDDRRAGEVIRGLRLMLKRGETRQEAFDANELVRDVLKLVRGDVLNAGVALSVDLAPTLPMLSGDRVQLQQVLLNLIVNGCESMSQMARRRRRLHVTTLLTEGPGVRVGVSDEGTGIPAGDLERVFEPFFTTKPQGLGLGLAVCRRIIAAHGGRLWADNNPVGGATFFFFLPDPRERKVS